MAEDTRERLLGEVEEHPVAGVIQEGDSRRFVVRSFHSRAAADAPSSR